MISIQIFLYFWKVIKMCCSAGREFIDYRLGVCTFYAFLFTISFTFRDFTWRDGITKPLLIIPGRVRKPHIKCVFGFSARSFGQPKRKHGNMRKHLKLGGNWINKKIVKSGVTARRNQYAFHYFMLWQHNMHAMICM